jgi:TetR/AcrR family transcriptional repressor of nem operon
VTATRPAVETDTATAILDSAERLVQSRGFNAFSYADIATELGLTKASLHYHFAGKAELGLTLLRRYSARFAALLEEIDARTSSPAEKLRAYCELYRAVLAQKRMCLCGMLAAEYETLPQPMRTEIVAFLDMNRTWLAALLSSGRAAADFEFTGSADDAGQSIVAALEGAMLVSRPYDNTVILNSVIERIVSDFAPPERRRTT